MSFVYTAHSTRLATTRTRICRAGFYHLHVANLKLVSLKLVRKKMKNLLNYPPFFKGAQRTMREGPRRVQEISHSETEVCRGSKLRGEEIRPTGNMMHYQYGILGMSRMTNKLKN